MSSTPPAGGPASPARLFASVVRSKIPVRSETHDKAFDAAALHRELVAENQTDAFLANLDNATFQENLNSLRALKTELNDTDWMFSNDT
jgi:hypothetical protein